MFVRCSFIYKNSFYNQFIIILAHTLRQNNNCLFALHKSLKGISEIVSAINELSKFENIEDAFECSADALDLLQKKAKNGVNVDKYINTLDYTDKVSIFLDITDDVDNGFGNMGTKGGKGLSCIENVVIGLGAAFVTYLPVIAALGAAFADFKIADKLSYTYKERQKQLLQKHISNITFHIDKAPDKIFDSVWSLTSVVTKKVN